MNSMHIHKVTELKLTRKAYLRESGEEFHTIHLEIYDKDHNTTEVILYSKNPVGLELVETKE